MMSQGSRALIPLLLLLYDNSVMADNSCCSLLSVTLSGSAREYKASRVGTYQLLTPTQYKQLGGNTFLYKWRNKSWFFGVDTHTSGIRSEETQECPEKIKNWKFWIRDEEWVNMDPVLPEVISNFKAELSWLYFIS